MDSGEGNDIIATSNNSIISNENGFLSLNIDTSDSDILTLVVSPVTTASNIYLHWKEIVQK